MDTRASLFTVIAALLLALGIAIAGYFVGNTLYKSKISANTASVKGLAERDVRADIALWTINFNTDNADLKAAYDAAQENQDKIVAFLHAQGFEDGEINRQAINANKREDRHPETGELRGVSYEASGGVVLRSEQVDKVASSRQKIGELVKQGVLVMNSNPSYLFTKLNDIKPEMLGEATRNARIAAEQFAKDANAKVGKIQSAVQGAFNFAARDASSEYGEHSYAIDKKVRVVTTITFYLED